MTLLVDVNVAGALVEQLRALGWPAQQELVSGAILTLDGRPSAAEGGVDKYRVLQRLKAGGMGAVYIAEHAITGRRHALKLMLPDLVANAEARDRLLREARVGALMGDDEHIVEVSDAGVEPSTRTPYRVMDLGAVRPKTTPATEPCAPVFRPPAHPGTREAFTPAARAC